ncbi:hypothetical protein HMPREF1221_01120 [Treponema socranskii subsp. paredis ATCC 35535]|nr:hypothetical protein HMPREF1221_01120 [Treponema socranskii subsp. paredis ATCC 35535]
MKIDAQFESKNGKLYALKTGAEADTGALIPFDSGVLSGASSEIAETEAQKFSKDKGKILAVYVPHGAAEISENMYDEMYLAALRVFLKSIEAYGAYAVVVPISDCSAERLTQTMCHTARRIKDCASVIGFALPDALTESEAAAFTDAMSAKHAHYVYFSNRYAGSSFIAYAVENGYEQP